LWLVDQYLEEGNRIIAIDKVIEKINISIIRDITNTNNTTNDLYIKEILYKNNGHWKLRDVKLDYMHPSEYSILISPPPQHNNLQVLKLFIDIYYDDFGTYRNVYHSLGGVYIQLGNMPLDIRKRLRNHFVLGFVPFGGDFNEFIHPFILDMKRLEQGVLMNIQGRDCWIIASLGSITADLPQGNDLVGVKRHGAIRGCRTCLVVKENATDDNLDIPSISRYHHITNIQFQAIFATPTNTRQNDMAKKYGLQTTLPILDLLQRERHLQSPQDIYHIMAGKILKFLRLTIDILSPNGRQQFISIWKLFEYPHQWSKLPNPISHIESFMMSDCLRLGMVMPFILNRFLIVDSLKPQELVKLQEQSNLRRNQIPNAIINCWVLVAKCTQLAFKQSLTTKDYEDLENYLKKERKALTEVRFT